MASKPIDIQLINIRPNDFYAKSLLNNRKPLVNISLELATKGHYWVEGSNVPKIWAQLFQILFSNFFAGKNVNSE